jgi:hypothetical protein
LTFKVWKTPFLQAIIVLDYPSLQYAWKINSNRYQDTISDSETNLFLQRSPVSKMGISQTFSESPHKSGFDQPFSGKPLWRELNMVKDARIIEKGSLEGFLDLFDVPEDPSWLVSLQTKYLEMSLQTPWQHTHVKEWRATP